MNFEFKQSIYSFSLVSLVLIAAMSRPIKLFQFTQKLYHSIGIHPPQSDENHLINIKNGLCIFTWIQMGTLSGAFFLFKAKRLDEYGISFHVAVSVAAGLFYFITNIYQLKNILKLIERFEEFIGLSKCI